MNKIIIFGIVMVSLFLLSCAPAENGKQENFSDRVQVIDDSPDLLEEPSPITPECADEDNDGFNGFTATCRSGLDCDDTNLNVHPRALEICDTKDNNCDGLIDDNQEVKETICENNALVEVRTTCSGTEKVTKEQCLEGSEFHFVCATASELMNVLEEPSCVRCNSLICENSDGQRILSSTVQGDVVVCPNSHPTEVGGPITNANCPATTIPSASFTCVDSDSDDYFTKGQAQGYSSDNQQIIINQDHCTTGNGVSADSGPILYEATCSNNEANFIYDVVCEFGCLDGACLTTTCIDNDGDGVCAKDDCDDNDSAYASTCPTSGQSSLTSCLPSGWSGWKSGETYILGDISASGECVVVPKAGITLDCQGHTISGNGAGTGIYILAAATDVTVKNCVVSGFNDGIRVEGNNARLTGNTFNNNNNIGAILLQSNNHVISSTRACGNNVYDYYCGTASVSGTGNFFGAGKLFKSSCSSWPTRGTEYNYC